MANFKIPTINNEPNVSEAMPGVQGQLLTLVCSNTTQKVQSTARSSMMQWQL